MRKAILFLALLSCWNLAALAQSSSGQPAGRPDDAAACAACGTCGAGAGVMIAIPIVIIVLNIALLVWVARDARSRGMDNSVLWMALVMFTSVIGLVIYISARPKGELVKCASCGNDRLQGLAKCPHCGHP